jgi:tetratricopeptide (TPR) repeat protein
MPTNSQHEYAVYLFAQGFFADALTHLDEVIREEETAERWSDWATAQFALSHFPEAERGFRRALELNPDLPEAAVSYGAMLVSLGRWVDAIAVLDAVLPKLDSEGRAAVESLAEQCRAKVNLLAHEAAAY